MPWRNLSSKVMMVRRVNIFAAFVLAVALVPFDTEAARMSMQHEIYIEGAAEYSKGHFARAEMLFQQALEVARKTQDSQAIGATLNRLGDVYLNEERFHEAERAYSEALSTFKHGPANNAALVATQRNLAAVYSLQGQGQKAIALLNEAFKLIQLDATDQPELAPDILNSLGVVYFRQENFQKAETLISQALQMSLNAGKVDPGVADSFNNLAMIYRKRHKYAEAEQAYKRSLAITEQFFGHVHPDTALTRENLGVLYTEMRRSRDAQDQLLQSLAITS